MMQNVYLMNFLWPKVCQSRANLLRTDHIIIAGQQNTDSWELISMCVAFQIEQQLCYTILDCIVGLQCNSSDLVCSEEGGQPIK